jgi:hypothetical protein
LVPEGLCANGIIGAESALNRRSGSAEKLLQWLEPLLFPMIPLISPNALGGHPFAEFATVLIRTPDDNSVLTLEAPEKRESESSGLIFRTGGRNLEGCVRETVAVTDPFEAATYFAANLRLSNLIFQNVTRRRRTILAPGFPREHTLLSILEKPKPLVEWDGKWLFSLYPP